MTSKTKYKKLLTEDEIGVERVFEVRILDLRQRGGNKQRSFSLSVPKGTKDDEYESADELKAFLNEAVKKRITNKKVKN